MTVGEDSVQYRKRKKKNKKNKKKNKKTKQNKTKQTNKQTKTKKKMLLSSSHFAFYRLGLRESCESFRSAFS